MIESILSDEDKVISSCAILDGEYGYKDVAIGVPCVLGSTGIKKIIELDLDEKTKKKFDEAVKAIKENIAILEDGGFFDK